MCVTEVTCAEAGVPAGTHSVVRHPPRRSHTGVCAAVSATCTACDTSAHLERRKVGDDGPLARPSSDAVTAETADLRRSIITFTPFRLSILPAPTWSEALPPSPHYPSRSPPSSNMVDYQHSALPALSSLAHLRVPITTIREHDRLPALSTTSTNYPYLGGTSSHASFVSD